MVLLAFVPSLGNAEMPFQWAVVCLLGRLAERCLCVWRCCCPTPLLLPWFVFPRAEGKGGAGGSRRTFFVTLVSLYNFACDSIVTFPVERSCLPKI